MIYTLLKYLVWLAIHIYFRKIELNNLKAVPSRGAVLLLGSHPNSFLDAVVLAVLLKRPLHFLARSDVFNTAWQRWILGKLHMIPIYRLEEGKENLGKNQSTFEQCKALFKAGKMVLIFPEGLSIPEKRLRKLKKGAAKIAFESEDAYNFQLNIQVVCVGINYTYPTKARESLLISFDTPFAVKDFEQSYQTHQARAIRQFNQKIEEHLRQHTLIIPEKSQEELAEQLLILARNEQQAPQSQMLTEKNALALLNQIDTTQTQAIQTYFEQLAQLGLQDIQLTKETKRQFWQSLAYYIALPLYLLGCVLYFLPTYFARKIAIDKTQHTQFYLSVDFALHFFFILFYLFFWWLGLLLLSDIWKAFLGIFVLMGLGLFTLYFAERRKDLIAFRHYQKIKKQYSIELEKLKKSRKHLLNFLT